MDFADSVTEIPECICSCQAKWSGSFDIRVYQSPVNIKLSAFPWVPVRGGKASCKPLCTFGCEPSWPETKLRTKGTQEVVGSVHLCAPSGGEITAGHRNSDFGRSSRIKDVLLVQFSSKKSII